MEKDRNNPHTKKDFWLRRFWQWLVRITAPEDSPEDRPLSDPEPPAALPPKAADGNSRGQLYKMLDSRPQYLAGNGGHSRKTPLSVYDYCGVVFPKADIVYHYLNTDPSIRVGDRVLVPVHVHGETKTAEALVVSTGQYLAHCVPHPVMQTNLIIRKL